MSSKGWDVDQQGSRKLMQAAKLSKHGVSSQPPELEESSQVETAKRGRLLSWYDIVPLLRPSFFVVVVLGLLLVPSMFPLSTLEVLTLVLVVVLVEAVLMPAVEKYRHPGTNYTHMHNKVSWDEIVLRLVPSVVVLVLWGLLIAPIMFPLLPLEVLMRMVPVLMLVPVLILGLKRYGHPHTNYTHMHNTLSKDDVVPWLVVGALVPTLGVAVALLARMFPLWRMLLLVLLVVLVLLLTLERVHQRIYRKLMQAAKPSKHGVSSQPPELEESSQVETAKRGRLLSWQWRSQDFKLGAANFWRASMHKHGVRPVKCGAHEWVLDSGAWIHHTSNLELLLEGGDFQSQELDNKYAPSSGDDAAALHAQGRGSVRTDCFDFPGVHYVVGDDTRNVVSVSQLARDHGLVTVFEPTSCHVKDKKTGKIVGKGRLRNGMYILDSLHIVGQHIGGGGASGGDRHDGADGGGGGNGDGDSTAEGRGGGGRDGRGGEGGTGARNQEESSGSGAAGGDINEINEEGEGGDEKEIEEMDDNDEEDIEEIGEINGKGEKEDDEKRGGQNSGQLSSRSHTGLFGMSRLDYIWWIVSILCIAACILQPYTGLGAGVKILPVDFHSLVAGFWVLFNLNFQLFKTYQELSHQEHNKRLFGLSRFDATRDPTGYRRRHLPARAFPTSTTNAARRPEHFFLDSGAPYHTTWNESILFPYPPHLQNHTKPPTMSLGGIAAGSIAVTRSGYLNGNKIMLDGVLLVLEAQANLVSVGQLSNQYDVNVQMDDEGVVIKKRRDGVQVGGGKMLESHHFVLQYFRPEGLFAHLDTPHPNIFGKSRPGPA